MVVYVDPSPPPACPACASGETRRDSASPWIFLGAVLLPPVSFLLFLLNKNRWCRACGVRYKDLR